MKDFSYLNNEKINDINVRKGKKIFKKQLKGLEGKNISINGIESRGIIYNHLNDMNTDNEDRGLNVPLDTEIKWGEYVYIEGVPFIVMSDIDNHYYYKGCRVRKCSRTIMLKGWDKPLPCYITNSSYGSKGEVFNNKYLGDFDARAIIIVGIDDKTKDIIEGTRFIIKHSKFNIYEVTKKSTAYHDYVELTCKYVKNVQEDDLENNIAYNYYLENNSETQGNIVTLEGGEDDRILLNSTMTYTINGIDKCVFILDEDTIENNIAEIVNFTDNTVTVKVLKPKMFQIECRSDKGTLLCTRTLYGARKM